MLYQNQKEVTIDEIKKIEIEILDDVVEFCDKNNLIYFLVGGTLLGSLRHKGFIPWDDDIDISMPRDSYEFFIANYENNDNYFVMSAYNTKDYYLPWAKVVYKKTILYEYVDKPIELGVYIDIFPMDTYKSEEEAVKTFKNTKPYRKFLDYKQIPLNADWKRSIKSQIKAYAVHFITFPFTRNYLARKIDIICKMNANNNGNFMANMVAMYYGVNEIVNTNTIIPVDRFGEFEGNYYKIPHLAETFLSHLYGEYMELPPLEKRITHHNFCAFWKE